MKFANNIKAFDNRMLLSTNKNQVACKKSRLFHI